MATGLLDFLQTPAGMGLLTGAASYAANAGRGAPVNSIGRGLLGGLAGYQGATDRQLEQAQLAKRNEYFDLQMSQAKQGMADQQAKRDWLSGLQPAPGTQGPQQMLFEGAKVGAVPVTEYLTALKPKEPEYKVVGDALLRLGGGDPQEVYRAPTKPEAAPSSVREYEFARSQGYTGSFNDWTLAQKRAGASSTSVTYGAPVAGLDAGGNPVFFQPPNKAGAMPQIIPGIQPPKLGAELREKEQQRQATIQGVEDSLSVLDKAITHPGRSTATGLSGVVDPRNYVPGTSARDFHVLKDQIGGKAFLQAFESLKGGGQITQVEGEKATAAIARLNTAQSDKEYLQALTEFREIVGKGYERLAGQQYQPKSRAASGSASGTVRTPMKGQVIDGYKYKGGDPADQANWERAQ